MTPKAINKLWASLLDFSMQLKVYEIFIFYNFPSRVDIINFLSNSLDITELVKKYMFIMGCGVVILNYTNVKPSINYKEALP